MRLLNIGCGPKETPTPAHYDGWDIDRLDMEARHQPDLLMDALDIGTLPWQSYDATYASHLLEHIYPVDLEKFMLGVYRVLKPDGWCEFRVPDALAACVAAAKAGSLDAPCYDTPAGMVRAWDILYGYLPFQMAMGRNMTHHNAYSQETLTATLQTYGFGLVYLARNDYEVCAIGCKTDLPDEMKRRMGIEQATGDCPVYPDDGSADVEPAGQLRAVAELPLRQPSRRAGDGHPPAEAAAGRRGTQLPRAAGLGDRV
jgi:hypothetical protein